MTLVPSFQALTLSPNPAIITTDVSPPWQIQRHVESSLSDVILKDVIDIMLSYIGPSNADLRDDFSELGQLSQQTKAALRVTGQHIREVDLSGIPLGKPATDCNCRKTTPTLQDFCVDTDTQVWKCYSVVDPQIFGDLFSSCKNITSLNVANCNINDACVAAMREALPQLQTLDLSGNRALSRAALDNIGQMRTLQQLSLRDMMKNNLFETSQTNFCFHRLAYAKGSQTKGTEFLSKLTALRTFDMSRNYFGHFPETILTDLVLDLQHMIGSIQTLTKVILHNCSGLTATQVEQLRKSTSEQTSRIPVEIDFIEFVELPASARSRYRMTPIQRPCLTSYLYKGYG